MKLLVCNGRFIEVRDVGPVLMRLEARAVPIKECGTRVIEDKDAREVMRRLKALKLYEQTI